MNRRTNKTNDFRPARGFTLLELLLAIGIFAIATTMAMALFPPAIADATAAHATAQGSLVCQAALTRAQTELHYIDAVYTPGDLQYNATVAPGGTYPMDAVDPAWQYVLLGRQVQADRNEYLLMAVACRCWSGSPAVWTGTGDLVDVNTVSEVYLSDVTYIYPGTPLIDRTSGRWAHVQSIDGTTVRLDRRLPAQTAVHWLAIYESGTNRCPAETIGAVRGPLAP